MTLLRPQSLTVQLALASLVSVLALGAVAVVGVVSMRQLGIISSTALRGQMELFDNASGLQELLYQKGFVSSYMLTADRSWLVQLDVSRASFARWLERAEAEGGNTEERQILLRIAEEYGAHDEVRRQVIDAFDAGRRDEALRMLKRSYEHNQRLLAWCQAYSQLGRSYAERELSLAQRSLRQRTELLILASVAGILASLTMGFLLARRIGRPIYELQLQVASAVQKTRVMVAPGRAGLEALGDHMTALVKKLEETDAAILEQRRRLMQTEKMSAIGDMAAKLAHEILNPLAGMKAAVQLLLRSARAETASAGEVKETVGALDQEISRIDQLVRRLINYAKPLAPRREPVAIGSLFEAVCDATRNEAAQVHAQLVRDFAADLPLLEVDSLLITQALVNVVTNAIQATPPYGLVTMTARPLQSQDKDYVEICVYDEGPGIEPDAQSKLFIPFYTTKPQGHGLGLAITQNIIMEHGGQISARNRDGSPGARFEILLPLSR